jgi:hypothetical protein
MTCYSDIIIIIIIFILFFQKYTLPGLDSRRVCRLVEVEVVPKIGVFKLIPCEGSCPIFSLSNFPNSGSTTRTASP